MKKRYLIISEFLTKNYKWLLILFFILSFGIIYNLKNLKINSDLLELLPKDDPIAISYKKELAQQSESEVMIVAFYINNNIDHKKLALDFYTRMKALPEFKDLAKTDVSLLLSYGFLNVSNSRLIDELMNNIKDTFNAFSDINPYDFKSFEYINDTIYLLDKLNKNFESSKETDPMLGYYTLSPDKKIMVMGVTFKEPTSNLAFVNKIIPKVKRVLASINQDYSIKTGLTGAYIYSYEANKTVSFDFSITTYLSIILIIIIFYITFGNIITTILVFVSLLISVGVTLGLSTIVFKEFNILTSFVAAITLGLGIDYGIHITSRLITEFKERKNYIEALAITYETVLIPVIFGVLTTIFVFLSLIFMKLPAFTQMALISSIGLFVFAIIMIFITPITFYPFRNIILKTYRENKINIWFQKLGRWIPKRRKFILTFLSFFVIVFSIFGIINFSNFSYTPPGLAPTNAESTKVFKDIANHFGTSLFNEMQFIVRIDEDSKKIIEDLKKSPYVSKVESYLDILKKQLGDFEKLKIKTKEISELVNDPFAVAVLKKYGIYSETLKIIDLATKSKNEKDFIVGITELIPENLRKNILINKDGKDYFIVYVTPSIDLNSNNGMKYFFDSLNKYLNRFLGNKKALYKLMYIIESRFYYVILFSVFMIGILTFFSRKSLKETIISIFGLIFTNLSAFGVIYFLDIKATFLTIISLPLIFGIGVDGYIHIFHAIDEDKVHYWHTLKATTLSFLTTISSFITFQLSRGELLKQFSLTMVLGISIVWAMTVLLIPSLKK
ncbi:efflux RND transporter permease subunit [Marinitoga aeolica]|uniref:MMPL family transporter n=1 Tax=Marinitoga aeolica TaxID=2809031 RepID=A0ABY8PRY7_9BACT|nr:MMPL family transporter [Marinitoga aeolica]WGS65383.1 MMPL family transporter [Marinitoga aeolica]